MSTAHYQVPLSVFQFVHSRFVDLMLANILEDESTILRCKEQNFTPSIFSIPQLLPSSEMYTAFVAD